LNAGSGVLGIDVGTPKGTAAMRASGSARGPIGQLVSTGGATGLNKNMLDNLNKQNRLKQRANVKSDQIEAALELRASKGELPKACIPVNNRNFEANQDMIDIANGKKEEEKKPPAPKLPPRMPSKQTNDNKNFGKVPKYLEKYKEEAKAKEDAIAEEKARKMQHQPPGTRLLPEDERLKTLEDLKANRI
jgi:phage-related minor tail protein